MTKRRLTKRLVLEQVDSIVAHRDRELLFSEDVPRSPEQEYRMWQCRYLATAFLESYEKYVRSMSQ